MRNPKNLEQFVVLVVTVALTSILVFLFLGLMSCNESKPSPGNTKQDHMYNDANNMYSVLVGNYVRTETDTFFCKPGETRTAYVCGQTNASIGLDVWWADDNGKVSPHVNITQGENMYYDPANGYYTVGIGFTAPQSGDHTYRFHLGTSNAYYDAIISVLPNRDYTIDYNCQVGCDLFDSLNVSQTPWTLLNKAYAGTHLVFSPNKTLLPQATVDYANGGEQQGFINYIKDPSNQIDVNFDKDVSTNKSYLVMVYDVKNCPSTLHPDDTYAGKTETWIKQTTDGGMKWYSCGYSFIFVNRLLSDQVIQKLNLPFPTHFSVTKTVTHELGHLRGRIQDITNGDGDHTVGHNGVGNNHHCAMFQSKQLISDELIYVLRNDEFCEGHKQILLNKHE